MGSFVQTWDSVKGRSWCWDSHQIPQNIYDQPSQGKALVTATSLAVRLQAKQGVINSSICLPLPRPGSHLEKITQAASTPVWTLTAMTTSTLSLIVSAKDYIFASIIIIILLFCACFMLLLVLHSFPSAARRGFEECLSHCSSGGFPDRSRMVTVSDYQPNRYWRYHM